MQHLQPRPDSILGRLALWALERAYGLTLCALLALVLALLSGGCASPEAAQELAQAQARMEAVRQDPQASEEDWRAAVVALAKAQGAYIDSARADAMDTLTGLPASAEGGAVGIGAAAVLWLLRQKTRRRLEDELEATHQVAVRALKSAEAAEELASDARQVAHAAGGR